jgi:hypothetical protein
MGNLNDLEAALQMNQEAFNLPTSDPETSWQQALSWANLSREFRPSEGIQAFKAAFGLLPGILWIGHSIPVRQSALRRLNVLDVTSNAVRTCISLSDPRAAVEMIEQGVATTFQQMLQLKPDADALPPDQAEVLLNLSLQLYSGTFTNPISIVVDRNKLLEDIRKQPGFEFFLLPKSYGHLCHASQGGPVVILSSHQDYCDGIIIPNPTSDPVHVPLPSVTLQLLKSQGQTLKELLGCCNVRHRGQSLASGNFGQHQDLTQKSFKEILDWLWLHVVNPIYQVLKLVSKKTPAILFLN